MFRKPPEAHARVRPTPSDVTRGTRAGAEMPLGNVSIVSHRATETQRNAKKLILSSVFLCVSVALCEMKAMPLNPSQP